MRHYMVDPDNEERLLKIPPRVVAEIKAEALAAAVQQIKALWTEDPSWDGTNWNNALHSALVTIDTHRESND